MRISAIIDDVLFLNKKNETTTENEQEKIKKEKNEKWQKLINKPQKFSKDIKEKGENIDEIA